MVVRIATRDLVSLAAGVLFGVGLGISGMTNPAKIRGFLDVTGRWDASLLFVMAGAIAVHLPLRRIVLRRRAPLFEPCFHPPLPTRIDLPLVAGSALFGIGWGLLGYCPGPAVVAAATLRPVVLVFVAAMVAGMAIYWARTRGRAPSAGPS